MGVSYEIFKDKRLIVVTCSGPSDVQETIRMLKALHSDPDFSMAYDVLWDSTRRTSTITVEDARELAKHVITYRHTGPRLPKRAYVVAKSVDYGMLRVYESYRTGKSDVEIEVFRDRDEAMKWLGHEGCAVGTASRGG